MVKIYLQQHRNLILSLEEWAKEVNRVIDYVVVEGIKDKIALKSLGVTSKILYPTRIEEIGLHKTSLILTDFDKEGEDMHKRIKERLIGISDIKSILRTRLRAILTAYNRQDIESINNLVRKY